MPIPVGCRIKVTMFNDTISVEADSLKGEWEFHCRFTGHNRQQLEQLAIETYSEWQKRIDTISVI